MIGQSCEHVDKPSLRINIVKLAGLDQGIGGSSAMSSGVRRGLIVPGFRRRKSQSPIRFIR
jgi:hypothetical protein